MSVQVEELSLTHVPVTPEVVLVWRRKLVAHNKRMLDLGYAQVGLAEFIGAYLAFIAIHDDQNDEFYEVSAGVIKRAVSRGFGPDLSDLIAAISGTKIPDVRRAGGTGQAPSRRELDEERRALRGSARRPPGATAGPALRPQQVRGRSLQLSPGFGLGSKVNVRPKGARARATEPGDDRLQSATKREATS